LDTREESEPAWLKKEKRSQDRRERKACGYIWNVVDYLNIGDRAEQFTYIYIYIYSLKPSSHYMILKRWAELCCSVMMNQVKDIITGVPT